MTETYEGHTSEPVYPTSVAIQYDAKTANTGTTAGWLYSTLHRLTPSAATAEAAALNGDLVPAKAAVDLANDFIVLQPGLWRCDGNVLAKETSGTTDAQIGVCINDGDATTFAVYDGAGEVVMQAGGVINVPITAFINVSAETNVALSVCDRINNASQTQIVSGRALFTRLSDYVQH